jgi:CRISPR system Cascade subunit CasA
MSLLGDASIRVELSNGKTEWQSLPAALALLMANELTSFPALRPHQRHAWHAFLSQLGAQALHVAGQTEATFDPPADESAWERLLRNLAPCDDAWSLVTQPNRPALLQPPLPDGLAALNKALETPDELDMLVTAKNHDLKQAVMARAEPDDWLFALVSLQTMGGFLGAGNYGISRMNGGFANRPAVGIVPPGGAGAHLRRDIGRMLGLRGDTVARNQCAQEGGIGLLWLTPWDGATSISLSALDPYYIEICRRVRLVAANNGRIRALAGSSKVPRVISPAGGVTGDPWAPLRPDKDGSLKVLTVNSQGFDYRRMVELMFPTEGRPSPLQAPVPSDPPEGLSLLARALVRGQGKTEGYHERLVPMSNRVRRGPAFTAIDPIAMAAHNRVAEAGKVKREVLNPALYALFQNGPDRIDLRHRDSERKAAPFLAAFDREVDSIFFPRLWDEAEAEVSEARGAQRDAWMQELLELAETFLLQADAVAPKASHRAWKARSAAMDELRRRAAPLRPRSTERRHDNKA